MAQDEGGTTQACAASVALWDEILPSAERELVSGYLSLLEPELTAEVRLCGELADTARHLILAGGRRVRPLLLLAACDALEGDWRNAVRQAVAVEFIHTASLIHDDIIDSSPTRRGVATVHEKFGVPTALLTGDVLCFVAIELGAAAPGVAAILARACREMCIGEAMAVGIEAAEKKTASLFAAAAEIGALAAGAEPSETARLRHYGFLLGMAYQLRDDQLDGEGAQEPAPYAQAARACLDSLAPGRPKSLLNALAEFSASRAR